MDEAKVLQAVLDTLNTALKSDHDAVVRLLTQRVPCNTQLANHPNVAVVEVPGNPKFYTLGAMGLINGLVHKITGKRVCMQLSATGILEGFVEYHRGLGQPIYDVRYQERLPLQPIVDGGSRPFVDGGPEPR